MLSANPFRPLVHLNIYAKQAIMRKYIGVAGLILGVIAVGVAIFQGNIRDFISPPEPLVQDKRSIKELAFAAGKKVLADKLRETADGPSKPQPQVESKKDGLFVDISSKYDPVSLVYALLGFAAMVLGVISWVKKDHIRISGGAISLGLMAVAWQYVLVGVTIAVIILILAILSA